MHPANVRPKEKNKNNQRQHREANEETNKQAKLIKVDLGASMLITPAYTPRLSSGPVPLRWFAHERHMCTALTRLMTRERRAGKAEQDRGRDRSILYKKQIGTHREKKHVLTLTLMLVRRKSACKTSAGSSKIFRWLAPLLGPNLDPKTGPKQRPKRRNENVIQF